jgi:hypothetical protein
VDESGNQTVVFGRRGSRPFNEKEISSFVRKPDGTLFRVEDTVLKDGQLQTASGQRLAPTTIFVSEPPIPSEPRSTERIFRRPSN